jgi:endonuclease-3
VKRAALLPARAPKAKPISRMMAQLEALAPHWDLPSVHHFKGDPFLVLISCLISLRTLEAVTLAGSRRLFDAGTTPQRLGALSEATIRDLIKPSLYYRTKAVWIRRICEILLREHGGRVPRDFDKLLELPGVGRKTANLVMTLGFGEPGICVDTHVHRITNRWGYVRTKSPEETEMVLRQRLPQSYWIPINGWLVGFGKNVCKPVSPFCSRCPLLYACDQRGVTSRR